MRYICKDFLSCVSFAAFVLQTYLQEVSAVAVAHEDCYLHPDSSRTDLLRLFMSISSQVSMHQYLGWAW